MLRQTLLLAVTLLVLAACGVPKEEYGAVVSERNSLLEYQQQLEEKHGALVEQYDALKGKNEELEAANGELGQENQALALEKESLLAENKVLADKNSELETEVSRLGEVEVERDALQAELTELRPLVDDEALRLEIEKLRQERDQLLSAIDKIRVAASELAGTRPAYWAGFACTGSMEPYFDCGDVGIYLADPEVEEIEVGDVIDFPEYTFTKGAGEPACSFPALPYEGIYLVHRVIAKRIEGDTTYYQTKGDANVNPDPCWIPYTYVNSKLIRVLADVRPEDVIDTTEYDAALEIYRRLERRYNELKSAYDEKLANYEQARAAYRSGGISYGSYLSAWENLEKAKLELNEISRLRNEAEKEFRRIEAETFGK